MVKFTNIEIRDGYIYSNATDMNSDVKAKVRLRLEQGNEDYKYYGDMTENMVKALWNLRSLYHKHGKLNETEVVN